MLPPSSTGLQVGSSCHAAVVWLPAQAPSQESTLSSKHVLCEDMSYAEQGIIGLRALASLSTLRTNGYPLFLVSGERIWC